MSSLSGTLRIVLVFGFMAFAPAWVTSQVPIQLEIMAADRSWTDNEWVGHAFMCVSVPIAAGTKEDCFGFYPRQGGKGQIAGPGLVGAELSRNPTRFSRISVSLKKPITEEQRRKVYEQINEWNNRNFDLTTQNCIDFVVALAQKLGWQTPPRVAPELPVDYVRKLSDANSPIVAMVGTWTGTMRYRRTSESFTITIERGVGTGTLTCRAKLGDYQSNCSGLKVSGNSVAFSLEGDNFTGTISADFRSMNGRGYVSDDDVSWTLRKS